MPFIGLRAFLNSRGWGQTGRGLRLQLLAVLTLSLSPLLVLSVAQGVIEFREERQEQLARFHAELVEATAELDTELERTAGFVAGLASYPGLFDMPAEQCVETLQALQTAQPLFANLKLINEHGEVVCSAAESEPVIDAARHVWFARLAGGQDESFSGVYLDWLLHRPVMTAAHRLPSSDMFAGAVAVDLDVRSALALLRTQDLPEEMSLALSDDEGNLAYVSEAGEGDRLARLPGDALANVRETGEPVVLEQISGAPGKVILIAPLTGRGVQLALISPALLMGSWAGFDIVGTVLVPSLMWLLALTCVSLAVGFFVLRWLAYLGRVARLYGAGRLDVQPVLARHAPVEIRTLADTMESMARDLNARTEELETVADQRGALLREIHHRVKNNLQVTMSLLNIQARRATDDEARRVLIEARGRINALALVHRTLYENDDLRTVEMHAFLEQLLHYLGQASSELQSDILLRVDEADVSLDPEQAIPVALFVTEAVTNAFKHAFPDGASGEVRVSVQMLEDGRVGVSVRDTGQGLGADSADGMGSSIMQAMARRVNGEMERYKAEAGGTQVWLRFMPEFPSDTLIS
jgi:two-component sensor histidine kinase